MRLQLVEMSRDRLDHEMIWGVIALILGVAGLVFPLERLPFLCMFKAVTGWPCLTCGMTRSLIRLKHLDLLGAFVANPFVAAFALFAGAFCLYAWIAVLFKTRRIRVHTTRRWEPTLIRVLVATAIVGNWAYLIAVGR